MYVHDRLHDLTLPPHPVRRGVGQRARDIPDRGAPRDCDDTCCDQKPRAVRPVDRRVLRLPRQESARQGLALGERGQRHAKIIFWAGSQVSVLMD